MAWNPNIPSVTNRVQDDLDAIRENFQVLDAHLADTNNPHNVQAQQVPYSSGVPGFTPASVKAALDALAGVRVVESGSNANGSYWRWENGLQIATSWCFGRGNGVDNWTSAPFTWAAAFTRTPALVAIPTGVRDDRDPTGAFDVTAWATYFNLTYGASTPNTLVFAEGRGFTIASETRIVAVIIGIGRWK